MAIEQIDNLIHMIYEKHRENQENKKYVDRDYTSEDAFKKNLQKMVNLSPVEDKLLLYNEIFIALSHNDLEVEPDGSIKISKVFAQAEKEAFNRSNTQNTKEESLKKNAIDTFLLMEITKDTIKDLTAEQYDSLSEEQRMQVFAKATSWIFGGDEVAASRAYRNFESVDMDKVNNSDEIRENLESEDPDLVKKGLDAFFKNEEELFAAIGDREDAKEIVGTFNDLYVEMKKVMTGDFAEIFQDYDTKKISTFKLGKVAAFLEEQQIGDNSLSALKQSLQEAGIKDISDETLQKIIDDPEKYAEQFRLLDSIITIQNCTKVMTEKSTDVINKDKAENFYEVLKRMGIVFRNDDGHKAINFVAEIFKQNFEDGELNLDNSYYSKTIQEIKDYFERDFKATDLIHGSTPDNASYNNHYEANNDYSNNKLFNNESTYFVSHYGLNKYSNFMNFESEFGEATQSGVIDVSGILGTPEESLEEPPITSGPPDNAASIMANLAEDLQFGGNEPEMEAPQAEAPEIDASTEEPSREDAPEVSSETELESEEPPISGSEPIDTSNLHAETIVMEEEPTPEIPVANKPEYEGPVSSDLAMVEEKPKGLFGKLGAFARAVFDRSDKRTLSDKWNRVFHNNKEFYTDETSTSNNASDGGKKGNETPTEEKFKQEQMQKQTGLEYDPVAAAKIEAVRNNAAKDNKNGANRSEANEKRQDDSERDDTH